MSDRPISRKEFLNRTWRGFLGFAGELLSGAVETIEGLVPHRLRPPGALDPVEFLAKCTRCGACIRGCPHFALREVVQQNVADHRTPFLEPRMNPCRWCNGFPCIQACPSGALHVPPNAHPRPIAIARVDAASCLRLQGTGCRGCGERCPPGIDALHFPLESAVPDVSAEKCIGCGACEAACPVSPQGAIRCEIL